MVDDCLLLSSVDDSLVEDVCLVLNIFLDSMVQERLLLAEVVSSLVQDVLLAVDISLDGMVHDRLLLAEVIDLVGHVCVDCLLYTARYLQSAVDELALCLSILQEVQTPSACKARALAMEL